MPRRPKYRLRNWYRTPQGLVKYTVYKKGHRMGVNHVPKEVGVRPMNNYVARLFGLGGKK